MTLRNIFLLSFLILGTLSCKKDDEETAPSVAEQQVAQDENLAQHESEDVGSIQDDIMGNSAISFARSAATTDTSFQWESCAQVTVVPKGANPTGKVTVDFGSGCTGPDGRTRKGKIEWTYTNRLREPGAVITTRFIDYAVKSAASEAFVQIDNSSTHTTTNLNSQAVSVGNPVLNLRRESSLTLRFSDNTSISWTGNRTVVWDLAVLGNRWDNVYTWKAGSTVSGTDRQGRSFSALVKTDVVRRSACALLGIWKPVSGVLEFTHNGATMSVDYGSGTCDRLVTVTRNGKSVQTRW